MVGNQRVTEAPRMGPSSVTTEKVPRYTVSLVSHATSNSWICRLLEGTDFQVQEAMFSLDTPSPLGAVPFPQNFAQNNPSHLNAILRYFWYDKVNLSSH